MAKNKGTFNQGWWNCFESFAAYAENSQGEQICTDVLRGAGITKREAEAWLDKPVQRNARAERLVRDYLNEHCR